MDIRVATKADWDWIVEESAPLGGPEIVSLGILHSITDHEALVAIRKGERAGFAIYRSELPQVELIGLLAKDQWGGTGTALMQELEDVIGKAGARSIILCTTNDNLSAIKFYQRRGFRFKAVHPGEFRNILKLKGYDPNTEIIGNDGIVIRDEIVLEKQLLDGR